MPLDFPNHPSVGQVFGAVGLSWTWDGVKWTSVPTKPTGTSPPADFNVLDFGAAGDGGTDDAQDIQTAIDAAAGHGRLRFPATLASGAPATYLIRSTLLVPSNSHLIIEAGATIQIGNGANCNCLMIATNASNVTIDLYGTLDGNAFNQTGGAIGGIVSQGICSNIYIDGFHQGRVTNWQNWPVSISRCTNGEVRNLAMTNSGNSCEFAGITSGGVTTKCYNVGFTNCTVQDIRDIGITLYGGCETSYIRGCHLLNGASALIFLDGGQPGQNVDCEISGCFQYGGEGGLGTASNLIGTSNRNCRIFNNTIENTHGAGLQIGGVDYCEVYGNVVHDCGVTFQNTSGQCGQVTITGPSHINFHDNTIRNPTSPGYYSRHTSNTVLSSPPTTYNPTTGAVSMTTNAAHNINVGDQFNLANAFGSGAYLSLNGFWTATAGTSGTTLNFTAPAGLTLTLKSAGVGKYTNAVAVSITSGTYDPATGNVVLTTSAPHGMPMTAGIPQAFVVSGITGTGPVANLNGYQVATAGTSGSTINFTTTAGYGAMTITGGTILPPAFGVSTYQVDSLRITRNLIGDWQTTMNMAACIGGPWGADGYSAGNIYGPKLATGPLYGFPGDATAYGSGSTQGVSYDTALDVYYGAPAGRNIFGQTFLPNRGLTAGWNLSNGRGEVDLLCGQSSGAPGGFNILQITNDGTINASVGVAGSLLANDGLGNTRLGGALVHGAMQTASLVNAGAVTVNANTSRVLIRNATSIAAATVVLPAPAAFQFTSGQDMELNFQNPIGALTVTAASGATVVNPPTVVPTAGASISFINSGTTWLRRIAT